MITTIHGMMDEALLIKTEGGIDNDVEKTTWVEYRLGDELVHRSVNMQLKKAATFTDSSVGSLN